MPKSATFGGYGRCASARAQLPTLTTPTHHMWQCFHEHFTTLLCREECEMKTIEGRFRIVQATVQCMMCDELIQPDGQTASQLAEWRIEPSGLSVIPGRNGTSPGALARSCYGHSLGSHLEARRQQAIGATCQGKTHCQGFYRP